VLMLLRVQRQVMSGIECTMKMAGQLADGDLRALDMPLRNDEFDQLSHAMNTMKGAWLGTVREVKDVGCMIMQFSQSLSDGSVSIHQSNQQISESLQQASEAVGGIRLQAHESTEAASVAETQAECANEQARKGGVAVAEVVQTIQCIETASQRIAEINSVIDGIAFQTNILALNAAVEAARAGHAGAGFAVVASEVRALAQRSAGAASDVRALINASASHVRAGVEGTQCAMKEIEGVTTAIDFTSGQIQSVATATRQQSGAMDQIAQTVESIGKAMANSSYLVSEWAQCSEALATEAVRLNGLADRFKI
jgi:methyl-accepting chemotaxis protein